MAIRRSVITAAAFVAATAGLTGCGQDKAANPPTTTTTTSTVPSTSTTTSTTPAKQTTVTLYFARGEKVGATGRQVDAATPARAAIEALLSGPLAGDTAAGLTSAVPAGTTVHGVDITAGTATVDLSSQFTSGGGSLSMQLRVAQVVYTLTQFPTVQNVAFKIDGKPVTAIGGEGVTVDKPQTRTDWESMTPAILLESPLPGDTLTSPFRVTGTANTFEATYTVSLTDSAGTKVYEHFGTATSGTGTRGTFDQQITYSGAKPGNGQLKMWEVSAKDGSPINVVSIPVTL